VHSGIQLAFFPLKIYGIQFASLVQLPESQHLRNSTFLGEGRLVLLICTIELPPPRAQVPSYKYSSVVYCQVQNSLENTTLFYRYIVPGRENTGLLFIKLTFLHTHEAHKYTKENLYAKENR
jgi:hypothetical protein